MLLKPGTVLAGLIARQAEAGYVSTVSAPHQRE